MAIRLTRGKLLVGDITLDSEGAGGGATTLMKCKKIAISSTPTGAEQDTGWDLPSTAIVTHVVLKVTTAEATGGTKTMDIGLLSSETGGDADGFCDGISAAATGFVGPGIATASGGGETAYMSGTTFGVKLASFTAGAGVVGDVGTYIRLEHLADSVTAKSVTYTAKDTDWAEFRGEIWIAYFDLAT